MKIKEDREKKKKEKKIDAKLVGITPHAPPRGRTRCVELKNTKEGHFFFIIISLFMHLSNMVGHLTCWSIQQTHQQIFVFILYLLKY
jgi:hypothetical protein